MTYIFKYAWLAILVILFVIWTVHVIVEFKDYGFDCFDEYTCFFWIAFTILAIFLASFNYFVRSL